MVNSTRNSEKKQDKELAAALALSTKESSKSEEMAKEKTASKEKSTSSDKPSKEKSGSTDSGKKSNKDSSGTSASLQSKETPSTSGVQGQAELYKSILDKIYKKPVSSARIPKKRKPEKSHSHGKSKKSKHDMSSSSSSEEDSESEFTDSSSGESSDESDYSDCSSDDDQPSSSKSVKNSDVDLTKLSPTDITSLLVGAGGGGGDGDPPQGGAPPGVEDEDNEVARLLRGYLPDEEEDTSDELPVPLARLLNAIWDQGLKKPKSIKIQEVYDKYPRPRNLTQMVKTDLNPEVARVIPKKNRVRDIQIRALQVTALKSAYGIGQVLKVLLPMESVSNRLPVIDILINCVSMLSYMSGKVSTLRRQLIKPCLDKTFRVLADRPKLCQDLLLGQDLPQQMIEATRAARVGHKASYKYKGKSHGRHFKKKHFRKHKKSFLAGKNLINCIEDWSYNDNLDISKILIDNVKGSEGQNDCHKLIDQLLDGDCNPRKIRKSRFSDIECNDKLLLSSQFINHVDLNSFREEEGTSKSPELDVTMQISPASLDNQVGKYDLSYEPQLDVTEFKAGSLAYHYHEWTNFTSDANILNLVKGVDLEFIDTPAQNHVPRELHFNKAESKFLDDKIQELLTKNVITECGHDSVEFISPIFLRPKKEKNSFRIILDLSDLNETIKYHHFKMDSFSSALNLVTPGAYMASLDIQDSYFHIKMSESSTKFLKFAYQDKLYKFLVLPQGLTSAPRIFTKLMKIPFSFLRKEFGFLSSPYIDDVFLCGIDYIEAKKNVFYTADVLQSLGFSINIPKSAPEPAQEREHVGYIINSVTMKVTMNNSKVQDIISLSQKVLKTKTLTIRKFAKLIGKYVATYPANKFGPLKTKPLEISKIKALQQNNYNFDAVMSLNELDRATIQWWIQNASFMEKPIRTPDPDVVVFTDSSLIGWGFHIPSMNISNGGKWPLHYQDKHINELELRAASICVHSCFKDWHNKHVKIMSDNVTTVAAISNMGSTKSPSCHQVAVEIWDWALETSNWISAAHVAGKNNQEADAQSRKFHDDIEWGLAQDIFDKIEEKLGPHDIDLFASMYNHKVPNYCSWKPDCSCSWVDAFSFSWTAFSNPYIFAPFSCLGKVIHKLILDSVQQATMIVPFWTTQPWFPMITNLVNKQPYLIPVLPKTLTLHSSRKTHPLQGKLQLLVLAVSSKNITEKDILSQSQACWSIHDAQKPRNSTRATYRDGLYIVQKNRRIPIVVL